MLYISLLAGFTGTVTFLTQHSLATPLEYLKYEERATGSLSSFITSESPMALQGVLNNIGSTGSKAPGAASGLVIASPSTTNPNCKQLLSCTSGCKFQYARSYLLYLETDFLSRFSSLVILHRRAENLLIVTQISIRGHVTLL